MKFKKIALHKLWLILQRIKDRSSLRIVELSIPKGMFDLNDEVTMRLLDVK